MFRLYFASLLLLCVSAFSAERVRVVQLPNGGSPAHAESAADGAIHLLYEKGEPFYMRSTDGGATFSVPLKLVDDASRKPGLEFIVWDMTLGKNGQVIAILGNNAWKLKLPKEQWGLFFTTLEPGAKAFGPLCNINHEPSEGFSVAADGKGNIALFWLKGKIFSAHSRDDGKTFSTGVEVNAECDPCPCCTTSAAYGSDGTLACVYREKGGDERDVYMLTIAADGKQARQKISVAPWHVNQCPMTYFNVNPTDKGWAVAWPTKGDIYFARYGSDGKILPPGEIKTAGKSGMRTGVQARTAANGETWVTWNQDGKLGWQIFDPKGAPVGEPGSAVTRGKGVAAVITKDGHYVLFK